MNFKIKASRLAAAGAICLAALLAAQPALAAERPRELVPVGQTVGMKIYSDGIIVVDISTVATADGDASPAEDAGLKKGDAITAANGVSVDSAAELAKVIAESGGEPVKLTVKRGGQEQELALFPARSSADGLYKAGMWIRDSVAGIGTITYYDPAQGVYGALGHGVSDTDTGALVAISGGQIVSGGVTGAVKGEKGAPGMLKGDFSPENAIGTITSNTPRGVFGTLDAAPSGELSVEPGRAVAGEATIISSVTESGPEEYSVEIEAVFSDAGERNMLITVTDQRLLELTGGIVQGMSGSPILQNGELVGAVTHVLIGDPCSGYGISIENMLEASGVR